MKKWIWVILLSISMLLSAAESPQKESTANKDYDRVLVLDDFNDGDLTNSPEWWVFDALKPTIVPTEGSAQDKYYLRLRGTAKDYYIGGMGFYFGRDAAQYDALALAIKGSGTPAVLRIQLFDDDNFSYELEQDKNYEPLYDDKYEHEIIVDWEGWQDVVIPFSRFVLMNPGVGDGIWNPAAEKGSGGLLHIQLILSLPVAQGDADVSLNDLCLVRLKNK